MPNVTVRLFGEMATNYAEVRDWLGKNDRSVAEFSVEVEQPGIIVVSVDFTHAAMAEAFEREFQ
jgi:hypothetical protein